MKQLLDTRQTLPLELKCLFLLTVDLLLQIIGVLSMSDMPSLLSKATLPEVTAQWREGQCACDLPACFWDCKGL